MLYSSRIHPLLVLCIGVIRSRSVALSSSGLVVRKGVSRYIGLVLGRCVVVRSPVVLVVRQVLICVVPL